MALIDGGSNTVGKANVDGSFNLQVANPGRTATGVLRGGGEAAGSAAIIFSENDSGEVTGTRSVKSPETDNDSRLRVSVDSLLDSETFNYTAQNTGKHNFLNTTLLATWSAAGLLFNSGSITTLNTSARIRSYAEFPITEATVLVAETHTAFSSDICPANVVVDIGLFRDTGANPFAPSDGAFFRNDASGLSGIISSGGVEVGAVTLPLTIVSNQVYKLTVVFTQTECGFWINDVQYGTIPRPIAQGQPNLGASLGWEVRHAIVGGTAGGVFQTLVKNYTIVLSGTHLTSNLHEQGSRSYGSHQGLSGGTMGSLASFANNIAPTAGAGSNTIAIIALLGGQVGLNAPAAALTDMILCSYQVPLGSVLIQGRRLAIRGVRIAAYNSVVAVATTDTLLAYSLAFGHTAVSLATAEAAATKAPRREALGFLSWAVAAVVGAPPREAAIYMPFAVPIYVNPGEFVAVVARAVLGTATATEIFQHHVTFDYGWE